MFAATTEIEAKLRCGSGVILGFFTFASRGEEQFNALRAYPVAEFNIRVCLDVRFDLRPETLIVTNLFT